MLCYLDNLLYLSDRMVPFFGKFDVLDLSKILNRQLPNIKIGALSALSCNASLKVITTFDKASPP